MKTIELRTYQQCAMINITSEVRDAVRESGLQEGSVVVYSPHTTAGVTINENADPDVVRDLLAAFDDMVPKITYYHSEGNSPAHLKTALVGTSVTIPVTNGDLALGTWQGIFFCEFDGARHRRYIVQPQGVAQV